MMFIKAKTLWVIVAFVLPFAARANSGGAANRLESLPSWKPDVTIRKAAEEINAQELELYVRGLIAAGTRHSASEDFDKDTGSGRGIGVARRFLVQQFRDISKATGGRLEVREDWVELVSERRFPDGKAKGANVIARLPGTLEPNRVVVISGHYDSINKRFDKSRGGIDIEGDAPGADDDASGTAVVVACARVLSKLQFPATIEFACYTAEEQGLLGSAAHAKQLKAAEAEVIGMFTNDIVGASKGPDGIVRDDFVRVFSPSPAGLDSPSRNLARYAYDVASMYFGPSQYNKNLAKPFSVKLIFRKDRYRRGGDHTSFETEGFPGIRFTEPMEDYLHQHENVREENGKIYGDKIEFLDFQYLARVARVNAVLAAELASAPPPPALVNVDGAVRNDTNISWNDTVGVKAKRRIGFEAVVRETTAPLWENAIEVSRGKSTIPVVLDNFIVGLRSVGADGRRSVAVVPAEAPESRRTASGPR
ncbi:MAG: M20/M25/M40 family metallo-hydrolase [Planctomycetota bacterium]